MFVLLGLTYFTQHHTLQFHPRWSKWVFVVSNGWGIFPVYRDHIFFIHSSFDGHRGSFHSLAIVDIAAINIGMQVSRRFISPESLGVNPQQSTPGSWMNVWIHRNRIPMKRNRSLDGMSTECYTICWQIELQFKKKRGIDLRQRQWLLLVEHFIFGGLNWSNKSWELSTWY